ncbi:hypothetical protein ACIQRK_11470 [Streptomyces anulatus]
MKTETELQHLVEGKVAVGGDDVLAMNAERVTALRTGTAAMIFQDPRAAINPLRRIGDFLTEGVVLPKVMSRPDATARATELLHAWASTTPSSTRTRARCRAACSSAS